jgi:hypothetical protein
VRIARARTPAGNARENRLAKFNKSRERERERERERNDEEQLEITNRRGEIPRRRAALFPSLPRLFANYVSLIARLALQRRDLEILFTFIAIDG